MVPTYIVVFLLLPSGWGFSIAILVCISFSVRSIKLGGFHCNHDQKKEWDYPSDCACFNDKKKWLSPLGPESRLGCYGSVCEAACHTAIPKKGCYRSVARRLTIASAQTGTLKWGPGQGLKPNVCLGIRVG